MDNNKTLMDYFGEKSAEFDSSGRMSSEEMEQILMGLIDPGKKLKLVGTAARRSGKTLLKIFDELIGRGPKQADDLVARKPIDTSYITGKNPNAVTMQDVLKGNKKSLDIPAFERQQLGLVKRTTVPASRKKNVLSQDDLFDANLKKNQSAIAKLLLNRDTRTMGEIFDVSKRGTEYLPALIRQQGKAGPGIPGNRAASDIMKILETIAENLK
tara:strand:- start:272 stop:910 length:639 start_codon:yes stop_codon:yes gene_type:complete